jgi:shikimate dehydrogenase
MSERIFAVIGHPIGHTMSPFIHARLFELSGKPAQYGIFDICENELQAKMPELKSLSGFNITIPHKQAIIPFLDKLDEKASLYGSVNTVHNSDGTYVGYTTDPDGFRKALQAGGVNLNGRNVILGAGGVARVMAFEAVLAGGMVTLAVRPHSAPKAKLLAQDIRAKVKNAKINICLLDEVVGNIDLLINATPVGMYPNINAAPINPSIMKNCAAVFDAVYNPNDTALLKQARENGALTIGGMDMLVWQAVAAHEIWDHAQYAIADIQKLCRDSVAEMNKIFGEKS